MVAMFEQVELWSILYFPASYWMWTLRIKRRKMVGTWIWIPREKGNVPSLRPPQDRCLACVACGDTIMTLFHYSDLLSSCYWTSRSQGSESRGFSSKYCHFCIALPWIV